MKGVAGSAGYIAPGARFKRKRVRPAPDTYREAVSKSQARQAAKLIEKLSAMTVERGASPAEARMAEKMLAKLK
jgi:hypothetical protein